MLKKYDLLEDEICEKSIKVINDQNQYLTKEIIKLQEEQAEIKKNAKMVIIYVLLVFTHP